MLTSAAPEPHIQRLLSRLAAALCDRAVHAAPDPRRLLPALDAKWADPALGVASPLACGGQLAEAGCGVLLLSSSTLDTRRTIALGQYVAAGEAALQPGCPELCVPVAATLWTTVHEQGTLGWGGEGDAAGVCCCCRQLSSRQAAALPPLASHSCPPPPGVPTLPSHNNQQTWGAPHARAAALPAAAWRSRSASSTASACRLWRSMTWCCPRARRARRRWRRWRMRCWAWRVRCRGRAWVGGGWAAVEAGG